MNNHLYIVMVSILQLELFKASISSLRSIMDCKVRNANYEKVIAVIDRYLKENYKNICSCPRCVSDIAALALNYLPPHYYVALGTNSEMGSPWVMVETAVIEAIDRVIENPNRHCDEPHGPGTQCKPSGGDDSIDTEDKDK